MCPQMYFSALIARKGHRDRQVLSLLNKMQFFLPSVSAARLKKYQGNYCVKMKINVK